MKKLENSASFEVAPQVMLISNMWLRRAADTCRERPPRKTASMRIHLKFSRTMRRDVSLDFHSGKGWDKLTGCTE